MWDVKNILHRNSGPVHGRNTPAKYDSYNIVTVMDKRSVEFK